MKEIFIIIFLIFFGGVLFVGCSINNVESIENGDVFLEEQVKNSPTEVDFIEILNTTRDGRDFLGTYSSVEVTDYYIIHPENFEKLKNETRFKLLYEDLPEKELYFVEFSGEGDLSLQGTVDWENRNVTSLVGVFIMGLTS